MKGQSGQSLMPGKLERALREKVLKGRTQISVGFHKPQEVICFSSSSSFFFPDSFLRTGEVKSPSSEVPGVWAGSLEQKARLPELGQATPPCPFPALLLVEKVTHGATEAESSPISSPKCGDSTLPHIRSFLGPALTHPYAPFHVKLPLNNKELSAHSCPRGCDTFCRKGRCA